VRHLHPRSTAVWFGLLISAHAAHSVEEYLGRLYLEFPPARMVSSAFSADLRTGFVRFNVLLVAFGVWCWLFPVRRGWRSAGSFIAVWIAIELLNGIGHPAWSLYVGGYTPGVATALVLLPLTLVLLFSLTRSQNPRADAPQPGH
jgi:hypothetical protein